MSLPSVSSEPQAGHARTDFGRRPQQPLLEQRNDLLEVGDVAVVALAVGLVQPDDFLARQAVAARQQIFAVAGQEIVALAQHDLQPVPFELEVADDLRVEQADRVAGRRIAEAGQEFVGHRGAADRVGRFEHGDLHALGRKVESAGQAVVARADDYSIEIHPFPTRMLRSL